MAIIVTILGVVLCAIGLIGTVQPRRLVAVVEHWSSPARYRTAVLIRFLLAVILVRAAPTSRLPDVVLILGAVTFVAAVALLLMGRARLDALVGWWLARPGTIRPAAIFAAALGALLVYAGA